MSDANYTVRKLNEEDMIEVLTHYYMDRGRFEGFTRALILGTAGVDLRFISVSARNPEELPGEAPEAAGIIEALLDAGADAGVRDKWGKRAAFYARANGKLKGTEALRRLEEASR